MKLVVDVPYLVDSKGEYNPEGKEVTLKAGTTPSDSILKRLIHFNKEFLDLKYDDRGMPILTPDEQKRFDYDVGAKFAAKQAPKGFRRYTLERLTQIFNEKGPEGLYEICEKIGVKTKSQKLGVLAKRIMDKQVEWM